MAALHGRPTSGEGVVNGTIQIDGERCKGCALCVEFCARSCIRLSEELNLKGYFVAAFDDGPGCNACGNCALMCPDAAIQVSAS
jgi:2-oxoglutarate ferredoxin oxidoreductase subunit delta